MDRIKLRKHSRDRRRRGLQRRIRGNALGLASRCSAGKHIYAQSSTTSLGAPRRRLYG